MANVKNAAIREIIIDRCLRHPGGRTVQQIMRDSKGRPVMDKSLNDTEIIPWLTDREEYLRQNVAPYSPDFIVDEKKTKIGYEIPFTREFYKYTPLKPSAEIFEELKALEQQEAEIMNKILH